MKDNLFEMLYNLFEKTITQMKEHAQPSAEEPAVNIPITKAPPFDPEEMGRATDRTPRIFAYAERIKLTNASYQFLLRIHELDILHTQTFEVIMNKLQYSNSRMVTLAETKWTIRKVLEKHLNKIQLLFLDLVLYQKEDAITVH